MSNLFAARLVGALFIISTGAYMTASHIISTLFSAPDFILYLYPNRNLLTVAALLEFVNSAAVVAIATVIFPIIKPLSQRIALTYVSFRIIEAVMLLIGALALFSLIAISKEMVTAIAPSVDYLSVMADVLKQQRYVSFQLGMIPLALCGFMLCVTFYQHRLVPRLLSALGLVGYLLLLLKVSADFFAINIGGGLLYIPGALFELLLPLWLFFKGFHLSEQPQTHEK
ncbi:DUF4386 domain-containing protein [Aliiglaciecola aliphaticivorans]